MGRRTSLVVDGTTVWLGDLPIINATHLGPSTEQTEFRLHHHVGSPCSASDYQPLETVLAPDMTTRIAAAGGRPTNSDLSYFNVERPGNEGLIVVVGWPGQWATQFIRDKENHLQVRQGQELTHFKLLPGEEVRSPLMVVQFWKGDRLHATTTSGAAG